MARTTLPTLDASSTVRPRTFLQTTGGDGAEFTAYQALRPPVFSSAASIASMSAGQAAGTATILAANDDRTAIKIVPPSDCFLRVVSGGSGVGGIPLFGGVPNEFSGHDCPMGALYITGLATGAALTIWEG